MPGLADIYTQGMLLIRQPDVLMIVSIICMFLEVYHILQGDSTAPS